MKWNLFKALKKRQDLPDTPAAQPEERSRRMIAELTAIDLNDPQNKLSREMIDKLKLSTVIRYAIGKLSDRHTIGQDLTELDKNIDYIIRALAQSVRDGWEMTAEWACTALVSAINELRTDIAGMDEEYAAEIMKCRVEYSNDLVQLVKTCREYDHQSAKLAVMKKRRDRLSDEVKERENHYQASLASGSLDPLLAELESTGHIPAGLSPAALTLKDELERTGRMKRELAEQDQIIASDQDHLDRLDSEIKRCREGVASPPSVIDPQLQEWIDEANRRF